MNKTVKRSLYQCSHAKVKGDRICCKAGHVLSKMTGDRCLDILRLMRGDPLVLGVCQNCPDYDRLGPPIPKEEQGWQSLIKKGGGK